METFINIATTIFTLTGAVVWFLGAFVVTFLWLSQRPPKD
jgi:hypothetical protein